MLLSELRLEDIKKRCRLQENGCWEWTGACGGSKQPRPQMRVNWKCYYVTRLVWQLVHGEDPGQWLVCHECDNPLCVNPAHLYKANQATNMRDASARGRFPGKTAITPELAQHIKNLRAAGKTLKNISAETGVSYGEITHIVYGYRHS